MNAWHRRDDDKQASVRASRSAPLEHARHNYHAASTVTPGKELRSDETEALFSGNTSASSPSCRAHTSRTNSSASRPHIPASSSGCPALQKVIDDTRESSPVRRSRKSFAVNGPCCIVHQLLHVEATNSVPRADQYDRECTDRSWRDRHNDTALLWRWNHRPCDDLLIVLFAGAGHRLLSLFVRRRRRLLLLGRRCRCDRRSLRASRMRRWRRDRTARI